VFVPGLVFFHESSSLRVVLTSATWLAEPGVSQRLEEPIARVLPVAELARLLERRGSRAGVPETVKGKSQRGPVKAPRRRPVHGAAGERDRPVDVSELLGRTGRQETGKVVEPLWGIASGTPRGRYFRPQGARPIEIARRQPLFAFRPPQIAHALLTEGEPTLVIGHRRGVGHQLGSQIERVPTLYFRLTPVAGTLQQVGQIEVHDRQVIAITKVGRPLRRQPGAELQGLAVVLFRRCAVAPVLEVMA